MTEQQVTEQQLLLWVLEPLRLEVRELEMPRVRDRPTRLMAD